MRFIAPVADRLLAVIVPRATAVAGCVGSWQEACGACTYNKESKQWGQSQKTCHYLSNCTVVCSRCTLAFGSHSICV